MKVPTITEMHAMTREQLLSLCMKMDLEIMGLEKRLQLANGYVEMAYRPDDEPQH